jgi:hypothetical protein
VLSRRQKTRLFASKGQRAEEKNVKIAAAFEPAQPKRGVKKVMGTKGKYSPATFPHLKIKR